MSMDKREAIMNVLEKGFFMMPDYAKDITDKIILALDKTEKEWCECNPKTINPRGYNPCPVCGKLKPSPKVDVPAKLPEIYTNMKYCNYKEDTWQGQVQIIKDQLGQIIQFLREREGQ